LIALEHRPQAIILANDQMAFGAVKAIRDAGLAIPQHIALIGFDNIPLCSYFEPPITSVEIPRYKLGGAAMEMLIELIENGQTEQIRWFKVKLIERCSTVSTRDTLVSGQQ
jgi:LacI family repressor for deo operon, udp, cdd, tsx, nupC, and nupG